MKNITSCIQCHDIQIISTWRGSAMRELVARILLFIITAAAVAVNVIAAPHSKSSTCLPLADLENVYISHTLIHYLTHTHTAVVSKKKSTTPITIVNVAPIAILDWQP